MAVYLSPGVFPREIDLSVLPAAVGPLRPAFVGTAKRGPIGTPVYLTSAQQALDTFGEPFAQSYLMYAVLAYLEEGNECYVVRVGIEYVTGQDEALNDIAIATDGSRTYGWGRIPLFSGIDHGKLNFSPFDSITFQESDNGAGNVVYSQPSPRPVIGATTATLNVTGTYTGTIDDSYLMVINSAPNLDGTSLEKIHGATYQIFRNSDGTVVASGVLVEDPIAAPNQTAYSELISIGSGLTVEVEVSAGALNVNDTFSFSVTADNRKFKISVEGDLNPTEYIVPAGDYTMSELFTTLTSLLSSETAYEVVMSDVVIDGMTTSVLQFRTTTEAQRIQIIDSQAFALTIGQQAFAFDIPRGHVISTISEPYNINSTNNRVKIDVINSTTTKTIEFNLPVSSASAESIAQTANTNGTINAVGYFESYTITVPGGEKAVVISTTANNSTDTMVLRANYSNVKTLRFAQMLGINYPYTGVYRGFSDSRQILPKGGVSNAATPYSCELDALGAQCNLDSDYYNKIVGYFVATSAGTWIDKFNVSVNLYTDAVGNISNRYVVTVSDALGVPVEQFTDVVFDKTADRYIANFLNPGTKYGGATGAKYINWEERPAYLQNDPVAIDYTVRNPSSVNDAAFVGAQNGIPLDPAYSASLDAAVIGNQSTGSGLYAFQNADVYDINLLLTPGFSTGAVIGTATQLCEARGDVLYIVDPPFGLRPQQVVDWHNGMLLSDLNNAINSSYAALYWGWIKYYDQFNVTEMWIPPSGHVAAVFSRTARTTEQWFAPAGLTRGRLLTALELEYTPSQGENDLLYGSGNAVNPIVKFPQDGIVVWGNRTLQRNDTALNRVNVRMLLIYLKKVLTRTLRSYVFEPNDKTLWAQVTATLNPLLGDIQSRRGLTAFKVVCDSTNNTPERIDRGELWISVFLKPTKSVEFIVLNLAVVNTGANFSSEAVLAAGGIVSSVASV